MNEVEADLYFLPGGRCRVFHTATPISQFKVKLHWESFGEECTRRDLIPYLSTYALLTTIKPRCRQESSWEPQRPILF
jgi:hypothetical protein